MEATDTVHEEGYDPTVEIVFLDYETLQVSNISMNNIDKIYFYDDPRVQMDGGSKCSVTNNVEILYNVQWYDNINKPTVHI